MGTVVTSAQFEALREIRERLEWRQPFLYDAGMTLMNATRDRIDLSIMDEATQRHYTTRRYNPNEGERNVDGLLYDPRGSWWNITQLVLVTRAHKTEREAFLGWFYITGQEPHVSLRFKSHDTDTGKKSSRQFCFGFPPRISAQGMFDMSAQMAGVIDLFINCGAIPDGIEPVADFHLFS